MWCCCCRNCYSLCHFQKNFFFSLFDLHCMEKHFWSGMESFSTWMVVNQKLQLINFLTTNAMASRVDELYPFSWVFNYSYIKKHWIYDVDYKVFIVHCRKFYQRIKKNFWFSLYIHTKSVRKIQINDFIYYDLFDVLLWA